MTKFGASGRARPLGFSILEVLVASVVLLLILGLATSMITTTSDLWMKQKDRSTAFEGANAAYETLTRALQQATLNTYWGYAYGASAHPTAFQRESELHFNMGRSATLLSQSADAFPGMAVFFQAPAGRTSSPDLKRLPSLLNGLGFFTIFSDAPDVPEFLKPIAPVRHRFRLMEWQEPAEQLQVYQTSTANAWFATRAISSGGEPRNCAVLAENVVAFFLLAEYENAQGAIQLSYIFDSRDASTPERRHQLPPKIHALMLVISEASALRLAEKYGSTPPPVTPAANLFQTPAQFLSDINDWERSLQQMTPKVEYQVFNSVISIKTAKWSQ